jgi:hypothetical protein
MIHPRLLLLLLLTPVALDAQMRTFPDGPRELPGEGAPVIWQRPIDPASSIRALRFGLLSGPAAADTVQCSSQIDATTEIVITSQPAGSDVHKAESSGARLTVDGWTLTERVVVQR